MLRIILDVVSRGGTHFVVAQEVKHTVNWWFFGLYVEPLAPDFAWVRPIVNLTLQTYKSALQVAMQIGMPTEADNQIGGP